MTVRGGACLIVRQFRSEQRRYRLGRRSGLAAWRLDADSTLSCAVTHAEAVEDSLQHGGA
jgi:hypothetical protein